MLILWLRAAFMFLLRLVIPPPPRRTRIDRTAPCPACGSREGAIETVQVGQKIAVQHHCTTCKCYWYEEPISTEVAIRATSSVNAPTKG